MSFGAPVFGASQNMGVAGYGQIAPAMGHGPMGGGPKPEVGFDTNSDAPEMLRSRVFVGNLGTPAVTREMVIDVFRQYGRLLGVSVFKGYAFIQFSCSQDADNAVRYSNKSMVGGQPIGMSPSPKTARVTLASGATGRSSVKSQSSAQAAARATKAQMDQNKKTALDDTTDVDSLPKRDAIDTLICGQCRAVYHDFGEYRDHRRADCQLPSGKPSDEPPQVVCFVCKDQFDHSWHLLKHLAASHNLKVYASDDAGADSSEQGEKEKEKDTKVTSNGDSAEQPDKSGSPDKSKDEKDKDEENADA